MPAYEEEIDAALDEGITLTPLSAPVEVLLRGGKVQGVRCMTCRLGERDESGRRRPEPIPGSERDIPLDTLVVAIGEEPDIAHLIAGDQPVLESTDWRTLKTDPRRLDTQRPGVFAGGDVVTGPNTVIDAIAAGRRAALMIRRYLCGEDLEQPATRIRPSIHLEPREASAQLNEPAPRAISPLLPAGRRRNNFEEVGRPLTLDQATREAQRCLRCDLDLFDAERLAGHEQAN